MNKEGQTKMLNKQKSYTSSKTVFCHFTQQNIIIRKYFHLFSITYQKKNALINLFLITYKQI